MKLYLVAVSCWFFFLSGAEFLIWCASFFHYFVYKWAMKSFSICVLLSSRRNRLTHELSTSLIATWIVFNHCLITLHTLSLNHRKYHCDVWIIMKCVYGFSFDTRQRLRTEFLIVSHLLCEQTLPFLLLLSLSECCCCCFTEEIIKYIFFYFDNCFKHLTEYFVLLILARSTHSTFSGLNLLVKQSHRQTLLNPNKMTMFFM